MPRKDNRSPIWTMYRLCIQHNRRSCDHVNCPTLIFLYIGNKQFAYMRCVASIFGKETWSISQIFCHQNFLRLTGHLTVGCNCLKSQVQPAPEDSTVYDSYIGLVWHYQAYSLKDKGYPVKDSSSIQKRCTW